VQEQPCLLPAAFDGSFGDPLHRGDLGYREAAEELEVHDVGQHRFGRRELVECRSQPAELHAVRHRVGHIRTNRSQLELSATLLRLAAPGVVDDQAAHHPSGISHEALLVGELVAVDPRQVEVRLVQQARRADRDTPPVARQLAAPHPVQLGVERREE
jgi:hypothetical protein